MTETKRPVSEGAERLLGHVFPVLDHGEVELVDYQGTDVSVARVARVSTGSERQDLGILPFLVRHRHTSPVEFAKLTLRVRAPWAIAQQWLRHRTGSFSVHSLRYQPPIADYYVPAAEDVQSAAGDGVKQGRGFTLPPEQAERVRALVDDYCGRAGAAYDVLTDGARFSSVVEPVAAELARFVLPQGQYTHFYWTTDAHNLMHWLRLRLDSHAQREIRAYGEVIHQVFRAWLPALCAAFDTYVHGAVTLSAKEVAALGRLIREGRGIVDAEQEAAATGLGMSAGERTEFSAKLWDAWKAGEQ